MNHELLNKSHDLESNQWQAPEVSELGDVKSITKFGNGTPPDGVISTSPISP